MDKPPLERRNQGRRHRHLEIRSPVAVPATPINSLRLLIVSGGRFEPASDEGQNSQMQLYALYKCVYM
jgi:hypothetical protein